MIRLRPSGILPLELWDLRVDSSILWDHMSRPDFGEVLKASLMRVWDGSAETRSEGPVPEDVRGFEGLYLAGGGASAVLADLAHGPWSQVNLSPAGPYAGAAGGGSLLAQHDLTGWVMDLGQSSLKISAPGHQQSWPRDFARLPVREDAAPISAAAQRTALRHFLADSLRTFLESSCQSPQGLVCALPSRLDDAGVPEGSSYIGMAGDAALLPEAICLAGLEPLQIFTLNDAELAATSARLDPRVQGRTLALTLGFGVGAALIT